MATGQASVRPTTGFTTLVLAGRRGTGPDPLAGGAGHRALLPVCGVPMLVRVVRALREAPGAGRIVISIGEPELVRGEPELADLEARGELALHPSLDSPSASVLDVLGGLPEAEPVLVTTADHPLLRAEIVDHFAAAAARSRADVLVGAVEAKRVRSRFPDAVRTWIRLRDGDWSGANLFALRGAGSRRAVRFWMRAEQFRKRPWRMVSAFGPVTLCLFWLGRLDLETAITRVSRRIGARVELAALPFPEAAIDVDRPADLELATRILAGGERPTGGGM